MKKIGYRIETGGVIHIVEMTKFELDSIQELLKRVPEMKNEFLEWSMCFSDEIRRLCLPTGANHALIRGACQANVEPYKSAFSDPSGNLLGFPEWRDMLLSRPVSQREMARNFPKISGLPGLGQRGIEYLIEALKESETT